MSNEELVGLVKAGNREAAAELWQQNQGFVYSLIQPYRGLLEADDLEQQAYLGMHYAALNFNPAREASFLTYLPFWIMQSVCRYISNCGTAIRLPVYLREKIRQRDRQIGELGMMLGRAPTAAEVDMYIGPASKVEAAGASTMMMDSLDRTIISDDGGERTLGDMVPAEGDAFEDVLERVRAEQLAEELWGIVDDALPAEQADVLRKRYLDERPFKEIAADAGISENGARVREKAALVTLRRGRRGKILRGWWSETYSLGLQGVGVGAFQRTWTSSTERAALKLSGAGGISNYEDDF